MPLTADPKTKKVNVYGHIFRIRELTIGEYDELEKKATTKRPNPVNVGGPEIEVTDREQLLRMMVLKAVVDPRLKASDFSDLPAKVVFGLNDVVNKMHFPSDEDARAGIVDIDEEEDEEEEEASGEG